MNQQEILNQINVQRSGLKTNKLRYYKNRIIALKMLQKNIIEMQYEIATALYNDLNKCSTESYMAEIGIVLKEISYMLKHIKRFAKPQKAKTPLSHFPAKSYSIACPYGQVLIISPWNYPFMLALCPLVDAISAGNCVVLKPSATSKFTNQIIEKLILKTFSTNEVIFVGGGRAECDFLLEQEYDYIFFTGSSNVGKTIMQKAAVNFTPITLELGGKSPCIVDQFTNIKTAAKRIIFGKLLNCGQTCIAPDYIYCHSSIKEALVQELINQINIQYTPTPLTNPNYPKIINEKQFNNIVDLIEPKYVLYGGKTDIKTLKIEPTLLDANFSSPCMQQEIFGPLLPIITFESLDEAIVKLNTLDKPLALYFFSASKQNQEKVLYSCDFGGGCINDTIMHIANNNLGFGGLKQSGLGAYHGKIGFETFSHYKSIHHKKNWLDLPLRYQPYTKTKDKLIKKFLK